MFTKSLFAAFISTLALSTFSSESTQAGRYRTEGPGNSSNSGEQAGRYRVESNNSSSFAVTQGQDSFAPAGQSRVAGRYRNDGPNFAPAESYTTHSNPSEYAHTMTRRAPTVDVSNKPANTVSPHDHK
jgi:hypothetical protein